MTRYVYKEVVDGEQVDMTATNGNGNIKNGGGKLAVKINGSVDKSNW